MKIYNDLQYKPHFTGSFIKNEHIIQAYKLSDDIGKGAFENLIDRMKNSADGYIFELILDTVEKPHSKKYIQKSAYSQFVLRIIDDANQEKKQAIDEQKVYGETDFIFYKDVLRKVNRILKTFYPKPIEQIKEENRAQSPKSSLAFYEITEVSDTLQDGLDRHYDLSRFDSFFREDEKFNKNLDMQEKLNFLYDEDDVELSDNIKTHMFDVLF